LQIVYSTAQLSNTINRRSTCCDFHQNDVENFIVIAGVTKLPIVYPLGFTGDRARSALARDWPRSGMAIAFRRV
jgi:hypothetical protein